MSAKIISIITLISFSAGLITSIIWYETKKDDELPLNCMTMLYINEEKDKNRDDALHASIKINVHFSDKGEMRVSEFGIINFQHKEYVTDRFVIMSVSAEKNGGYREVKREKVITNERDNVPPLLTEKLTSRQPVLYYKFVKLGKKTWKISDLQRTILVCRS